MPQYTLLESTASTNTYLAEHAASLPHGMVVYTHHQTAGRGQKGNSWEAEPGKNLTFSMLLRRPAIAVKQQFAISEAVSLAIAEVAGALVPDVKVKWPNDIYCGDRKLCGILIEHSLEDGAIAHTIAGVGLNVNQLHFCSDAPNPVSLAQITGHQLDLDALLRGVCERIEQLCDFASPDHPGLEALHSRYLQALYRHDGQEHPFALAQPDGQHIEATIHTVEPDGMLVLRHRDGTLHRYAFKEVKHIISNITL